MENNKIQTYYLTDVKNPLSIKSYFELYENLFNTIDFTINKELLELPLNNYCNSLTGAIKSIIEYLKINNIEKDYYFILGKKINILLHNFENKMLESGIDISSKLEVKEVYNVYKELAKQNGLIKTKNYLPHAYEIEKEFNEFIKIEAPETKEPETKSNFIIEKNPFPDVFTGTDNKNYLIFKSFTEKYIIDRYNDFSLIIQKMKNEKRITRITHFELMKWLKENNFISEKTFEDFIKKGTFTTKALLKPERQNSYDLIIIDIDKRNFE